MCLVIRLVSFLLPAFLLVLPTWGDAPDELPLGTCYLGSGKMLEASPSHQLSLNAHVERFLYQPGGLEIAYQGSQNIGGEVLHFIRLVGVKQGIATILVSTTDRTGDGSGQNEAHSSPYKLAGWSGDGRYLLLSQEREVATPDRGIGGGIRTDFSCVDVGVIPPHLAIIPLPTPENLNQGTVLLGTQYWWTPDRMRVAFAMPAYVIEGDSHVHREEYHGVYELKTGDLQDITLTDKQFLRGWLDRQHLLVDDHPALYEDTSDAKVTYGAYDTATRTTVFLPAPKKPLPLPDGLNRPSISDTSPKAPYMRLEDVSHHIQDPQKTGTVDAHSLWVRRTQGPPVMCTAPVGLTPGAADTQAVWSPTGTQVAFIAHGDLFVTDLTMRDATPIEKYKAGETLTCVEERDVAASNLKQIGLAIFQYIEDHDENYPSADRWQEKIRPYLGPDTSFSTGQYPIVYQPTADLALAHIDMPADEVIATVDLPCASLALMADGHVRKFIDKASEKRFVDAQKQFEASQKQQTN